MAVPVLTDHLSRMRLSKTEEKKRAPEPEASSVGTDGIFRANKSIHDTKLSPDSDYYESEEKGTSYASTGPTMYSDEADDTGVVLLEKLESSGKGAARMALTCLVMGAKLWPVLSGTMAERMAAYKRLIGDLRECCDYVSVIGSLGLDSRAQQFRDDSKPVLRKLLARDPQLRGELAKLRSFLGLDKDDDRYELEYIMKTLEKMIRDYDCGNE